jgi:D-alanyl-D-alanine-carboxypeptidase/D-alanyl-D-alanine-endopeptidase
MKLLLAALLLTPSLQAQNPLPSADPAAFEIFRQTSSTSMVLVIVRNNEIHMQGFGSVTPGAPQAPGPNSLLRLCSITKIFATDLLIKLANDKAVRLDDPLQIFAPTGKLVPVETLHGPATRAITLADLATHTAGLPREMAPTPAGTPPFTFPNFDQRWSWLPNQKLRTAPGDAALYSNVGFDLLGDALASAAHTSYPQLLADHTTTPLGLRDTTFTPTPAQCSRLLLGFHEAQQPNPCTPTDESAGSSGLYSTPTDMARWLQYLLGVSALKQNPTAQATYLQPANLTTVKGLNHAGDPNGIGLGWISLDPPQVATRIVEKTGGGGGFTTYIALDQAHHTGVFIALTEGNGPGRLNPFRETNNILLALSNLPPMPPAPGRPPAHHRKSATRKTSSHKTRRSR